MSRIPESIIEQIFSTAQIEEVIGEFVQLKKSGSNLKGLSPFNNEKSPSFMVSPAKQIFKDFSSGKGGNVVTFLMELEQMSYPEALRWIAKKYTPSFRLPAAISSGVCGRSSGISILYFFAIQRNASG